MDERVMQFRVGFVVAASLLVTAILVIMFAEPKTLLQGSYPLYIEFDQAPGVLPDTPVRKSGIRIGRVVRVEFAKDDVGRQDTRVLVTVAIDNDKMVYQDEVCQLQTNLLGDAVLEFIRSGQQDKARIEPGSRINGTFQLDPARVLGSMQEGLQGSIDDVRKTALDVQKVAQSLNVTLQQVNDILKENRGGIKAAVDQAEVALRSVSDAANVANQLFGDPETQQIIRDQIRRVPALVDDVQKTLRNLDQGVRVITETAQDVKRVTGALGSEESIAHVKMAIERLGTTTAELEAFAKAVNNSDGTLNRLVHDPELYQSLNRAAQNVERLTKELRPILDDARVFTDKVSRHPGVIVRDAIRPGPGIK